MNVFVQHDVELEHGATLPTVTIAYATRGTLAADKGNAILVAHGYTSGPQTIDECSSPLDGSMGSLIGPGRAIDTDKYFVICPNALGSSFGSTNAVTVDPRTDRPYGSSFPAVTMRDIVAGQYKLLESLGISKLVAVVGASFGGLQALQWGIAYPDMVGKVVCAIAAPKMPGVDVVALEKGLSALPGWNGGDYYGRADLKPAMFDRRIGTLKAFGGDKVLEEQLADPAERSAEMNRLARAWSDRFDPNSLLILFKTMAEFDVTDELRALRAPVLYVLSSSDRIVPASLGLSVMRLFEEAGVDATYVEIDSEHGHSAAGSDAHKWAPQLQAFLRCPARGD